MDKIIINKLKVFCHHGVFEEEKINGQDFYVSAVIGLDVTKAGRTDNLDDSVNYADICITINDYMQNNRFNLIETVATGLADLILEYHPLIKAVKIQIDKPQAPIGLPLKTVSLTISRGWHKAYISFGSNMGDSASYIANGIEALANTSGIRLVNQSSIIVTSPYGGVEQDDFLNGCVEIDTYLSPEELLTELHRIEAEAGRVRDVHWGPRTLDLDIIFYDDYMIHTPDLIIPHVDMENRTFVLGPLNEIAPYAYNPVTRKTVAQMYKELMEKE